MTEFSKVDLKLRILYITALITTVSIGALINIIPNGVQDFISQAPALIAETAISIIVTIFIIEKILDNDKKKDRIHTYESLSNAICRIAYYATQNTEAPILKETEDEKQIRSQLIGIISTNTHNLRKEVPDAIREIANKTYEEVEKRRTDNCLILKMDCTPDSRQLVKQQYLRQPPLRTVLEIYSQEMNAASSCCTPFQ